MKKLIDQRHAENARRWLGVWTVVVVLLSFAVSMALSGFMFLIILADWTINGVLASIGYIVLISAPWIAYSQARYLTARILSIVLILPLLLYPIVSFALIASLS